VGEHPREADRQRQVTNRHETTLTRDKASTPEGSSFTLCNSDVVVGKVFTLPAAAVVREWHVVAAGKLSKSSPPEAANERRHRPVVMAAEDATQAELLHARLAPMVNRLVWSFLGADPDRDDIAHEIFIKIFRGVEHVRDSSRLEAWAMRVTMNCLKNEFRRRKLRRFFSFDAMGDEQHPRVHPDFEGREVVVHTHRILEALPVDERLALTLRLFEEASDERIAHVCGFSVRTARRRVKAARERFVRLAQHDPLLSSRIARTFGESTDE
jgi:RNA polymerase sigma-70 factor (ECF subfamily)